MLVSWAFFAMVANAAYFIWTMGATDLSTMGAEREREWISSSNAVKCFEWTGFENAGEEQIATKALVSGALAKKSYKRSVTTPESWSVAIPVPASEITAKGFEAAVFAKVSSLKTLGFDPDEVLFGGADEKVSIVFAKAATQDEASSFLAKIPSATVQRDKSAETVNSFVIALSKDDDELSVVKPVTATGIGKVVQITCPGKGR